MDQDQSQTVALGALNWLLANEDLRGVFLGASGLAPQDLRERAAEPELLASVLDFILMDDAWVTACCDAQGLPYDAILRAREGLPGGQQVHWT
nr:DUF3572 domain-containing protein [Pseudooceanicola batsensis]